VIGEFGRHRIARETMGASLAEADREECPWASSKRLAEAKNKIADVKCDEAEWFERLRHSCEDSAIVHAAVVALPNITIVCPSDGFDKHRHQSIARC